MTTHTATRPASFLRLPWALVLAAALMALLPTPHATAQPFGPGFDITTGADGARSVYAADIDGDGDLDVLSASGVTTRLRSTATATRPPGAATAARGPRPRLPPVPTAP